MKLAKDCGRKALQTLALAAVVGVAASPGASAQVREFFHKKAQPVAGAPPVPTNGPEATKPQLELVRIPTNATDPIAKVNGEIITRQQLADECVAREGPKILETLIARRLIEQEMKKRKIDVTAQEIDQEIDRVAQGIGHVSREVWLRTLDKEKGISPASYARDIIYPTLALKKLAEKRVVVTEQDLKDSLEANYGPRLRARIIMTNDMRKASEIWEELRKNPAGFDKIAQERSLDQATRPFGGLLPEPIARHAVPREVSDAAFAQLVDGDPNDKDPSHKPKDGNFTGPIQVNELSWIIVKREALAPGRPGSLENPTIRATLEAQMKEVKLQSEVQNVYAEMMAAAEVDNLLTGTFKKGHEEQDPDYQTNLNKNMKLMSEAGATAPTTLPKGTRDVSAERTSTAVAPSGSRPPTGNVGASAATLQNAIKAAPPGQR